MTDDSIPDGQTDDTLGRPLRLRCRCLLIHAPDDLRIEEQDAGGMAPGQVTVQVGMGGICGSDLHYFHHGGFGTVRIKRPMVLGHEVAGTVIAVAPDVTRVQVGDRVAVNPSRPCGECKFCLEGLPNQCLEMRFYGSAMRDPHVEGAFRQLLVCNAVQCETVAPGVSLTLAALEGLSFETLILFPLAVAYLGWLVFHGQSVFVNAESDTTRWLLAAAGPTTAIPLLLFAAGARRIPMSVLGMLQYMSPSLQMLLGVWVFHEAFSSNRLVGFLFIWGALAIYMLEGWLSSRKMSNA